MSIGKRVERLERFAPKATGLKAIIRTIVAPDGSHKGAFAWLVGVKHPRIDRKSGEDMAAFHKRVELTSNELRKQERLA